MDGLLMMDIMKNLALAAILCLVIVPSARAYDEPTFCAEMQETAKTHNATKSTWIDRLTKSDDMTVNCKKKRVVSKQKVTAATSDLKDEAMQNLQKDWNDNFCPDEHFRNAIKNGWSMVMNLTFNDGKTIDLTAECP